MYAHNSALHVVAGERVDVGQVIAEAGSTGLSRGPHVHFELMYKGKNCDPAPLLRPALQADDAQVAWHMSERRPRGVRCARRRRYPKNR